MTKKDIITQIHDALETGQLYEAQNLIDKARDIKCDESTLHYLQGMIFMKRSLWGNAISSFLRSEELDPDGPAHECRLMLSDIMNFYNKDMYNH